MPSLPDYTTIHATDTPTPLPTASRESPICDLHDGNMHRRREGLPALAPGWRQVTSNADAVTCDVCRALLAARREQAGERIAVALACLAGGLTAAAPMLYRAALAAAL